MALPASVPFNGRDVTLWTCGQLENASKLNLKQRALNLRDLIGEDQLPPLNTSGPAPTIILWLLEVQVALCKTKGLNVEVADFGWKPSEEFPVFDSAAHAAPQRAPPPFGTDAEPMDDRSRQPEAAYGGQQAAYNDAVSVAQAARQRNQGTFAFGDDAHVSAAPPRGNRQQQASPATNMDAYETAAQGAQAARERNRGSNIFG